MEQESTYWRQIEEARQHDSTWRTQTEERLARLETLVRLSCLISSSLEMTQVLTAICQATATLLHVPHVTIYDTGVGFVPEQTRGKAGLGLASMEERVRLVQGTFTLVSQPGQGTTIEVRVPLDKGEG